MKTRFVDIVPRGESRSILSDARRNPTRRLSQRRETEVAVGSLCQPFDVKGRAGPPRLLIGTPESGHFEHTLESVLPEVDVVRGAGIRKLCLRLIKPFADPARTIDEHASQIEAVRRRAGDDAEITVDPFSIALTPDLTWGVFSGAPGAIDVEATLDLIATAAICYAQAGADGFLTLGRVPYEARVARAAMDAAGLKARVLSFSTNSETPNAYINDRKPRAVPRDTGQKILVGNATEMILRALLDIDEGTDVVAHKPIEGVHVVATLRNLLDGETPLESFLMRPQVERLLDLDPRLRDRMEGVRARFADRARGVRLAAYTVSGTFSVFKLIERKFGGPMAFAMLDELYTNFLAAGAGRFDSIIDRNALWYARGAAKFREPALELAAAY